VTFAHAAEPGEPIVVEASSVSSPAPDVKGEHFLEGVGQVEAVVSTRFLRSLARSFEELVTAGDLALARLQDLVGDGGGLCV
jgi:hypothetical protein